MKTLIYQYWVGKRPAYSYASEMLFRSYAKRIGAEYFFSDRRLERRCMHGQYFGALRPIFEKEFHSFDAVLYVDMDIIPAEGLNENIFSLCSSHIMMAEEEKQPKLREDMRGNINHKNDMRWKFFVEKIWRNKVLADEVGRPRVFNSGAVLYSKNGMMLLEKLLPSILKYQISMKLLGLPRFYLLDQNFLNAFILREGIKFLELPKKWNSQVTSFTTRSGFSRISDDRSEDTCFVHMQHGPAKQTMSFADAMLVSTGEYDFGLGVP